MPLRRSIAAICLLAASLAATSATKPTTMPSRGALPDRPGQRLERVLALDDLTADQRVRLTRILDDAREEVDRARSTTAPAARGAIRDAVERARGRIIAVLTPAQRDRLRRGEDAPATAPATPPTTAVAASPVAPTTRGAAGVGERLPTFSLANAAGGKPITFESLVGKPAVLVFGSYSSPAFRDQLLRIADLATRYGGRVKFVVVYTREMFPATDGVDQPERNQDAKISVGAAATDADRLASAKAMVDKLKLKLPVGVDAIDDRLTSALEAFPDAAIVADAKGVIIARQTWTDPFAIRRALDTLLAIK